MCSLAWQLGATFSLRDNNYLSADTTLLYFVSEKIDIVAVDRRNSFEKGYPVVFVTLQDGGWDEKSDP